MPRYVIEWDPSKAEGNQRKHGVSFEAAAPVLRDPLAMTVYDDEHSDEEDRWVTVGRVDERILIMIHTFHEMAPGKFRVRIISARRATRRERGIYEERT